MADQQPQFRAPPSRYTDPQQLEQIPKELPVQLYLLPLRRLSISQRRRSPLPRNGLSYCSRLLLGDSRPDAVEERKEEREVDSSRDLGSVLEVEGSEI